nr:hypothetical protein [Tanacetum cinerariifolium]
SDIPSKESTIHVVYDVLKLTPFYKAFLVTSDVPKIYMQEFWAIATVHHHLINFKMNNKKRIVNLKYFREMLHICPRIPNQPFDELPFKEEILAFLRNFGHSEEIKNITDVNINKLHQPRRSFADVINKCLSDIRNSAAYKEYYAIASGAEPPKTKTFAKRKQPAKSSTAKGLTVLSEVALTEAEQMKLATLFRSDIPSKESTIHVVYDVLKLTPFYKAFLVTADVPKIYMQEFWAIATVHHHLINFKMNNKKRIVNLKYFREMLHICPRIPNQPFDELPFKEEILVFLRNFGHSEEIKNITDVNINKLHQPRRSFADVINKCLSGKSTSYDSL